MRNARLIPAVAVVLLLALVVVPVHAVDDCVTAEDWLHGASRDFLGFDLMDPKPAYQKTLQDNIKIGEYYQCRCKEATNAYYERLYYDSQQVLHEMWHEPYTPGKYQELPSGQKQEIRNLAKNTSIYTRDPQLSQYDDRMMKMCDGATTYYNEALRQTPAGDYRQQAEIYDTMAEVYDTTGMTKEAAATRQKALDARVRAEARDMGFSDCLIVTATFGSPMAGEVQMVRDFRDDTIKKSYIGSRYVTALNAVYYSFSPAVARSIDENPAVKPVMRFVLAPLIGIVLLSQGVYSLLSFSPGAATVVFIITGGALVGLVYILPVMLATLWVAARRKWQVPALKRLIPVAVLWAGLLAALVFGAVLKIDLIAVLSSGLLFACTVFLTAGAVAFSLLGYIAARPAVRDE